MERLYDKIFEASQQIDNICGIRLRRSNTLYRHELVLSYDNQHSSIFDEINNRKYNKFIKYIADGLNNIINDLIYIDFTKKESNMKLINEKIFLYLHETIFRIINETNEDINTMNQILGYLFQILEEFKKTEEYNENKLKYPDLVENIKDILLQL